MAGRAVTEQAKGIIVAAHHCTADEAFAILTKIAEYARRGLRDVNSGARFEDQSVVCHGDPAISHGTPFSFVDAFTNPSEGIVVITQNDLPG
jgi:hypothetical protein